jgi:hypothetical protein
VVDGNVVAAARDEFLAAMRHHEDVGQAAALQWRQLDGFLPAGQPRDPFFRSVMVPFASP